MKRVFGGLFLFPIALTLAGCAVEKSENPLTPTVAGPLPGVGISAPSTVDPAQGSKIPVTSQPVTLTVVNATTNGVRPLSYLFQVATDVNFVNVVFSRDGVTPGDGRTSVRLQDPLPTGRSYYWHARAGDGANWSEFSNPTVFDVFTPVVIDRPIPISPIGNATLDTLQPRFRTNNAARSGPAGPISYEVQVADNTGFGSLFADWAFPETPSTSSLTSPVSLANSKQYYWRIRAYETTVVGPWSDIQAFRTPAPAPVPPPTPNPGPGTTTCSSRQPIDIVTCQRALYPSRLSPGDAPNLLRAIAVDLNRDHPSYYGRLLKSSGNNCGGYACDIICAVDGNIWDVFGDGPDATANYAGAATPQWSGKAPVSPSSCQLP